jgi:hypothetical protein
MRFNCGVITTTEINRKERQAYAKNAKKNPSFEYRFAVLKH